MTGLLAGGYAFWIFPVSLLAFGMTFGLLPGLVLRLLLQLYPKDDPRRSELLAELYGPKMTRLRRFEWVFQQLETALRDGLSARRELRRRQKRLVAARQRLIEFVNRTRGEELVNMTVTVTCHRAGDVRKIFSPADLTTNDMASGTTITVRLWGFSEPSRPEPPPVEIPAILDWSKPLR